MKKIILLLLFFSSFIKAQEPFSCDLIIEENYSHNTVLSENYDADTKYVLNIYFTFINYDDETSPGNLYGGNSYGENDAMEIIKILNVEFNQFNIFFKYKGFRVVNNTQMTNNLNNLNGIPNMYNFYLLNSVGIGSGWAIMGNTLAKVTYSAYESVYREKAIIHEIGHLLNLAHTFQNSGINNPNNPPEGNCERVTRDLDSPYYNADIAGDRVHDTAACISLDSNNYANCVYIYNPNITDCHGTPFENVVPGNFMSYEANSTCGFHFTPGQGVRMRSHLQNPSYSHVPYTYNTIESLYEPFEIDYIPSNEIVSVETSELGEGFALVCRINTMKHRFQKSFDYLVDPDEKSINPLNYSINELPEIAEIGNYKLTIFQVDHEITKPLNLYSRCVICNDEPYVGGNIISTEFMGSYNFTQQTLNQIQVSDPNLLQNLESEKYHIIKKETESGAIKQIVIYKY